MSKREPTEAERQASEWLVLLESPVVPQGEIARFQAWLAASDENKRAWALISRAWDAAGPVLAHMRAPAPANDAGAAFGVGVGVRSRRNLWVAGLAAASAAALVLLWPLPGPAPLGEAHAYTTAALAPRTLALDTDAGRTLVELSPLAQLDVAAGGPARRAALSDGAAFFDLGEAGASFLVVTTPFGEVRGTDGAAFAIWLSSEAAEITVLRGEVSVSRSGGTLFSRLRHGFGPRTIGADESVRIRADGAARLGDGAAENGLAWRRGDVALSDVRLEDAAREVTRYSGVEFRFEDARLARTRVSGYLRGGDVAGFLALLEENFAIEALPSGSGYLLQRAPD